MIDPIWIHKAMIEQDPESIYKENGFTSKFYVDPLFRAEEVPSKDIRVGFTVTHIESEDVLTFPSISSLVLDEYPEFSGGDPSIDHSTCEFDACSSPNTVQPIVYVDSIIPSQTSRLETTHKPLCNECYEQARHVVEEHLSEHSEILADYLSKEL